MKKYLTFAALILSAVLALSGCYPTGDKKLPSNDAENSQPFSGNISGKFGEAEFDYEVSPYFPNQLPKIKLKLKEFDAELLKKVLLSGKTLVQDEEMPDWWIEATDGSRLRLGGSGFDFADGRVDDNRSNFFTIAQHYNYFCRSSSEQLSSFSSRNAVELVNKILDEIGVENYGEPCVIAISPEMGNAYLKANGGVLTTNKEQSRDDYDPWEEDGGVYVLKYRFDLNGTDVCSGSLKTLETARTVPGADITAFVTKDLIFNLEINSWYDAVPVNEETVSFKFSAKDASDALIEHYSKITTLKYPTYFTECRLEYVPAEYKDDGEVVFTPAWCFMGHQIKGGGDWYEDFAEYYYTETGIRYGSY